VVAVASSAPAPAGLAARVAWLDLDDPEAVLRWLAAYLELKFGQALP
jgi:molybdopterin-guanine dinucleotide biosynthesis protein B